MSLLVIAGFVFVPMLLLLGAEYSASAMFRLRVSRGPYFTGLATGYVSLLFGIVLMIERWGDESKPEYYKPVWDALLTPSIVSLVTLLGLGYMLKIKFSRRAFMRGWISGLASALGTLGLFCWYFT
ncbi:hypothetical protein [Paraburkholderia sp. J8-2]|uniref:hypothetical protein n=1 Tax=Paraburkholderia sp. J8-2 TaxID=2805440 RepID=UPI002AB6E68B|nr:hypothetical protein [Paraburkholderia sp. J8-2]